MYGMIEALAIMQIKLLLASTTVVMVTNLVILMIPSVFFVETHRKFLLFIQKLSVGGD